MPWVGMTLKSRSSNLPAMSWDFAIGSIAPLLWEGAPSTPSSKPGCSKPLAGRVMPRGAASPAAAKHPPLWPEPIQQHSFEASDQLSSQQVGLASALHHSSWPWATHTWLSYSHPWKSAFPVRLHRRPTQMHHSGREGRRLWLRTERSSRDTQMVTPSRDFLSLPAAFLAVKCRGLNKTQTSHQLYQQSKNIVTVVNASKWKMESRFQPTVRHASLSLMRHPCRHF